MLSMPRLRRSTHPHPALIIRRTEKFVSLNFISSGFELKGADDFSINLDDEDPKEIQLTGLTKSSYLIREEEYDDLPVETLKGILLGKITGNLKEKIEDWWGEPIGS